MSNLDFVKFALEPFDYTNERKQKIFIVEGPDGTGKTTVCNFLSKLYDLPIIHLIYYEKQEDMDKQYERVFQLIHALIHNNGAVNRGLIFDRFTSSNRVYSGVFKNSKVSPWTIKIETLIQIMSSYYNITFINCLPKDKQEYLNRYKDIASLRDELYGDDLENMGKVYDEYKVIFSAEKLSYNDDIKKVDYDYLEQRDTLNIDSLIKENFNNEKSTSN